jgi:hypothetical protein
VHGERAFQEHGSVLRRTRRRTCTARDGAEKFPARGRPEVGSWAVWPPSQAFCARASSTTVPRAASAGPLVVGERSLSFPELEALSERVASGLVAADFDSY